MTFCTSTYIFNFIYKIFNLIKNYSNQVNQEMKFNLVFVNFKNDK